MAAGTASAQHALPVIAPNTPPGSTTNGTTSAPQPFFGHQPQDSTPPPASDAERHWRDRLNPLAPIVRGIRTDDTAVPQSSTPTLPPANHTTERPTVGLLPLQVQGRYAQRWKEGNADAWLLRGDCAIRSGHQAVTAQQMVLWRTPLGEGMFQVSAYLEGDVQITRVGRRESQPASYLEVVTGQFAVSTERTAELNSPSEDPVYARAAARRGISTAKTDATPIRPVQFINPQPGPMLAPPVDVAPGVETQQPTLTPFPTQVNPTVMRHVSIYPRALGEGFSMQTIPSQNTTPPEYITTITGGVRIVVDGVPVDLNGQTVLSTIDLAADRVVIWTDADRVNELSTNFELGADTPFEVYLEGDIVVRQGTTVVQAERAFYNLAEERGMLSNSELRGFLPELNTIVRLRADEIRQVSHDKFHARQGWITTSDMGIPGYRIQASDIFVERRHLPGYSTVNPQTGEREGGLLWFTSSHNRLYVENVPVAYFPYVSSPAEDPGIPLRSVNFGYSTIFGAEVKTVWDVETLFGLNLPDGMNWRASIDYMSERGPAAGTKLRHNGAVNIFGMPAISSGEADLYYINDGGRDLLGADRRNLVPETEHRGKALMRHRLDLPFNTWLQSELGYLSDRNVREQFWESDWDSGKDYENLLQLNHQIDNFTASLLARTKLNDFEYTTQWLPRGDATLLAEPIGNSPLLWSTHSSVGYASVNAAEAPPDPLRDPFTPLPFYADRQGVVAMTRHEFSLPLSFGPVNVVPYALGEAAFWQEDLTGDELGRLYGSVGVRGSVMASKYMPQVYSPIFGLNGLAHKMVFDADYYYAESTESLGRIAQYNEFDEDAQERFRTRLITNSFGGMLPAQFEPRNYALRSGAGRSVTAPWHELVDDQHAVRLGWRHRLQTRVGNPQAPRIYDWMTLDLEASVFPNAERDNFGETVGLISADYAWNVGPQTSLLANTVFDVFDMGQRIWNVGVLSQRNQRGSIYLGVRGINAGPIDTALLVASMSYHPSEKWIMTAGTAYDVVENLDRGQTFTVTRVGEYLMLVVGAGYDRSRNAWSLNFSIQPKFGGLRVNSTQLNSLTGVAQ